MLAESFVDWKVGCGALVRWVEVLYSCTVAGYIGILFVTLVFYLEAGCSPECALYRNFTTFLNCRAETRNFRLQWLFDVVCWLNALVVCLVG